jgi:SAM-dependent methyltransferase
VQGDATSLPFPDQSYAAVLCQFGPMFFPDREAALREMLRVLVSNGRMAMAVWNTLDHCSAYADEVDLVERCAGPVAADALRSPFALGRAEDLLRQAQVAGMGTPEVHTHAGIARFPSLRAVIEADLRRWLPMAGISLNEGAIWHLLQQAEDSMARHVNALGRAEFPISAHLLTGTKAQQPVSLAWNGPPGT